MKVVAIVVARKGSKRIPRKAHQEINGEGLVARKLRQLSRCPSVGRVILGTDDEDLRDAAEVHGAVFVLRPPHLCDEVSATPNDMIQHMVTQPECDGFDTVLWAQPTNPLVGSEWYEMAIEDFVAVSENWQSRRDSLASATMLRGHFWTGRECRQSMEQPINWDPQHDPHMPARALPPIYAQDGAIFIRRREDFARDGRFVGARPFLMSIPAEIGWDVNEPWELDVARMLAREEER